MHQIYLFTLHWSRNIMWLNMLCWKQGENRNKSLSLAWKYAQLFVREHYLFWNENRFARVKVEGNCYLWGTDNVKDKYASIFLRQIEAIEFIILQIFLRGKKWLPIIKYLMRMGCLFYTVVWYDFMNKQKCPFFLTIANHSLTWN